MRSEINNQILLRFFALLTLGLALPSISYSSNNNAQPATEDCISFEIAHHSHIGFVDPMHFKAIDAYHQSVCNRVQAEKWDRGKASKVMQHIIIRSGICRDDKINTDYEKLVIIENKFPDSVVLVYETFCQDTYNPENKLAGINFTRLQEKMDWLGTELFCQTTHEMAYPSGFWETLLEPDLPSIMLYRQRTDAICRDLRSGSIVFGEAVYRWKQADMEFEKRLGPETVKQIGKDLKKPIETLINMFKQ